MQALYFPLLPANSQVKISMLEAYHTSGDYNRTTAILILAMMVQILLYILAGLHALTHYNRQYKSIFSKNQLGQLRLFRAIYRFFLIYFLVEFSFSTIRNFTSLDSELLDNWSLVVWTFFIYGIGYIAIQNPGILLPQIPAIPETNRAEIPEQSINKQKEKDSAELATIITFVRSEKAFKNPDLSLPDLAGQLGLSTNRASFLLNNVHGMSFYDFVNTQRVQEVRKLLDSGSHKQMSIIGLAREAGFRSKASFYKFFKREFGKTPTEYLASFESRTLGTGEEG